MPAPVALKDFVRQVWGTTQEEFEDQITDPHLLVTTRLVARDPGLDDGLGMKTVSYRRPVGQSHPLDRHWIVPIAKEPGKNRVANMVTLGRAPNNDIVLLDYRISKFHCFFQERPQGWVIADAGSHNGSVVDGTQLEPNLPMFLASSARIVLSDAVHLEFLLPGGMYERMGEFLTAR